MSNNIKSLYDVFIYSIISGFFLVVLIQTGLDVSEEGIAMMLLEPIVKMLHTPFPFLIPVISAAITIIGILKILYSLKQISEYGIVGAIVSGTGFFGALTVFSSSYSNIGNILYLGVALWIIGIFIIRYV
jgi:hypothetical protein